MNSETTAPRIKRTRRSTGEIVDLLMAAAAEEFEDKGYSGATTSAIAKRAGVAEALLFNHFGSKSQLFQDTIFKPLGQHFDKFIKNHPTAISDSATHDAQTKAYIAELQKFISDHSGMFLSLVFAQSYKAEGVNGLGGIKGLNDYFEQMSEVSLNRFKDNPKIDPKWMARISFATILSCAIFGDWLFPEGESQEGEIQNAISDFVLEGLNANERRQDNPV